MSHDVLISQMLARWEDALEQGQQLPAAELCREHPELLTLVQQKIHALQALAGVLGSVTAMHSSAATPLDGIPTIAGYEILEVLGRGGMGLVYRARHRALQRIVALKMILAGAHASAEDLARFRQEAEAVARLQHPHIVQIYEIGDSDGQPFFALEYVAGGSLDRKTLGQPLPAAEAAQLVATLARAIHCAHEQGIVHRDLKPANILLTPEGEPKIADFGLAKRIDADAGHTRTGTVLGTPSYMAPEQARGETAHIGAAADVYALGAILYGLLTGRPPFLSDSVWETLCQVIGDEPVPPRRLQPRLDRDLETICLKCLEKEPARRYATALALSEDLALYRLKEPIRARPLGAAGKLVRWTQRRPMVAALLGVTLLTAVVGFTAVLYQWRQTVAAQHERTVAHLDALATAPPESVPLILDNLRPFAADLLPLLRERFQQAPALSNARLRHALALAEFGELHTRELVHEVRMAAPREAPNFLRALRRQRTASLQALYSHSHGCLPVEMPMRCGVLSLHLDDAALLNEIVAYPKFRAALIHGYAEWHGDLADLRGKLAKLPPPALAALCLALGQREELKQLAAEAKLTEEIAPIHRETRDAGVHAASGWLLDQWRLRRPQLPRTARPAAGQAWFVNNSGLCMVHIPGKESSLFASSLEVPGELFEDFLKDDAVPPADRPAQARYIATQPPEQPVHTVTWYEALLFCNWLSRREGRQPCYTRTGTTEKVSLGDGFTEQEQDVWACDFKADGYRLPTEAEWERLCRAGTTTAWFFGDNEDLLPHYAWFRLSSKGRIWPGGRKLPSPWGLFDVYGNVAEWCWDRVDGYLRVQRGGQTESHAPGCTSAFRNARFSPLMRQAGMGFRVVCQ